MYVVTFQCAAVTNFDERSAGIPKAISLQISLGYLGTIYGLWQDTEKSSGPI